MDKEKAEFAKRLRAALQDAGIEVSAAVIEPRFNSRYDGTPVSPQAISGWLAGRYLPKQDKIRVLAEMVGLDPQFLQYGSGKGRVSEHKQQWPTGVSAREKQVIDAFLALPPKRRELVGELVEALGQKT